MSRHQPNMLSRARTMRERVDARLARLIEAGQAGSHLEPAVKYSLLAPGKRLRPLLCMMSAECLGAGTERAIDPACAIEMVHTASLIVDDLPCMDDADMRRGQPATHKEFGSASAILVAFDLLNTGYRVMSEAPGLSDQARLELARVLARATGSSGLIGGQVRDLEAERGRATDTHGVKRIHELKTGALFVAAAESGAIVAGLHGEQLEPIRDFASRVGLAYQTLDDLLDVQGTLQSTGKDVGKDSDKATLVGTLGPAAAQEYADHMIAGAVAALHSLGPNMQPLEKFVQDTLCKSAGTDRTLN